jgi:hypothetical protein
MLLAGEALVGGIMSTVASKTCNCLQAPLQLGALYVPLELVLEVIIMTYYFTNPCTSVYEFVEIF